MNRYKMMHECPSDLVFVHKREMKMIAKTDLLRNYLIVAGEQHAVPPPPERPRGVGQEAMGALLDAATANPDEDLQYVRQQVVKPMYENTALYVQSYAALRVKVEHVAKAYYRTSAALVRKIAPKPKPADYVNVTQIVRLNRRKALRKYDGDRAFTAKEPARPQFEYNAYAKGMQTEQVSFNIQTGHVGLRALGIRQMRAIPSCGAPNVVVYAPVSKSCFRGTILSQVADAVM